MNSPHLDDSIGDVPKYPEGTNYEYHEPPFVEGETARDCPSLDKLTGTYDVVLHAEHWVGDKLTTVRGGTLVVERTAHRGVFRFDIGFLGDRDDVDDPRDEDDPRDLSFSARDDWCVLGVRSSKGRRYVKSCFNIPPSPGAVSTSGRVRIVAERCPLFLPPGEDSRGGGAARPESDGRPPFYLSPPMGNYDEEESERLRRGEDALRRYRDDCSHWLHNHTPLPTEVVAQVRRYLYPPPVWFYEAGDLWIEGMWKNSCPLESWYHDWRYVARRRRSDGPMES